MINDRCNPVTYYNSYCSGSCVVYVFSLGLEWNSLGLCSEALTQFCSAVATNHSIETLDLRNNQLDEGCAAQLANMLRKNITLRSLGQFLLVR